MAFISNAGTWDDSVINEGGKFLRLLSRMTEYKNIFRLFFEELLRLANEESSDLHGVEFVLSSDGYLISFSVLGKNIDFFLSNLDSIVLNGQSLSGCYIDVYASHPLLSEKVELVNQFHISSHGLLHGVADSYGRPLSIVKDAQLALGCVLSVMLQKH